MLKPTIFSFNIDKSTTLIFPLEFVSPVTTKIYSELSLNFNLAPVKHNPNFEFFHLPYYKIPYFRMFFTLFLKSFILVFLSILVI